MSNASFSISRHIFCLFLLLALSLIRPRARVTIQAQPCPTPTPHLKTVNNTAAPFPSHSWNYLFRVTWQAPVPKSSPRDLSVAGLCYLISKKNFESAMFNSHNFFVLSNVFKRFIKKTTQLEAFVS